MRLLFLLCRKHEEEIRETHAETNHINQVIAEKDEEMAELKRQAAQGRPVSAGASSSANAAHPHAGKGLADDDSPKSNMSSPWGTDVSPPPCPALPGWTAYVVTSDGTTDTQTTSPSMRLCSLICREEYEMICIICATPVRLKFGIPTR